MMFIKAIFAVSLAVLALGALPAQPGNLGQPPLNELPPGMSFIDLAQVVLPMMASSTA